MHRKSYLLVTHLFFIIFIIMVLFPILYIITVSFNKGGELFASSLIPAAFTLQNYINLFTKTDFVIWIKNSIFISSTTAILAVFLTSASAYAFSRFKFWGKKYTLTVFLIIQLFPGIMSMVAIFKILQFLGLLDTHAGLILVYLGWAVPFSTWMMKGYFDTLPKSLEDAAYIDGATRFKTYIKIMLPLAKPIMTVVVIYNFIGAYSDFALAAIALTTRSKYTLALGLRSFHESAFSTNWPMFTAGALIGMIPILIAFFSAQRYLIAGLTSGAVKN